MLAKLPIALLVLLACALLASGVPTIPPKLVPSIDTNSFKLKPLNDGYFLSIRNPDGAVREETVRENAPGQLDVKGILHQYFIDKGKTLDVHYEAGANGYVAKYIYGNPTPTQYTTPPPPFLPPSITSPPAYRPIPLNGCTLKTCTG